jgi:integrase
MASIMKVSKTGFWTLKTEDANGKDKRIKLRRFKADEPKRPIPDDVLVLARKTGKYEASDSAFRVETQTVTADDRLVPYIKHFKAIYSKEHRPDSAKRMAYILELFARFARQNGVSSLNAVTPATINQFFYWRLEQRDQRLKIQVQPHVAVSELGLLSGLFTFAIEEEVIDNNPVKVPAKRLRKAYPPPQKTKYLSPTQVKDFLKNLNEAVADGKIPLHYADLARITLYTGLRITAAIQLRFDWIDNDAIMIPKLWDKAKVGYEAVIHPDGLAILERRRKELGGTGRVFPTVKGQDHAYHYFRKVGVHPHQLRHTFATLAVDAGLSIQTIGGLLGHRHVATTERYAKLRDEVKRQAVSRICFGTDNSETDR